MAQQIPQIDHLEMNDLLALQEHVEKRLEEIARSELEVLEEKMSRLKPYVKRSASTRAKGSTGKVAPKYKDPKSGKTWSGRGRIPVWLREKLEQGHDREEFAIS